MRRQEASSAPSKSAAKEECELNVPVKPFSRTTEEFLEDLAAELEVPKERYEAAEQLQIGRRMAATRRLLAEAPFAAHVGAGFLSARHGHPTVERSRGLRRGCSLQTFGGSCEVHE